MQWLNASLKCIYVSIIPELINSRIFLNRLNTWRTNHSLNHWYAIIPKDKNDINIQLESSVLQYWLVGGVSLLNGLLWMFRSKVLHFMQSLNTWLTICRKVLDIAISLLFFEWNRVLYKLVGNLLTKAKSLSRKKDRTDGYFTRIVLQEWFTFQKS